MNKTQVKRLEKVYDHLMTGELGHKKFDFNCYNNITDKDLDKEKYKRFINVEHFKMSKINMCGTVGCAEGEFPIIWPKTFIFSGNLIKHLGEVEEPYAWFGLEPEEYDHLFYPNSQNPKEHGGKKLRKNASKESVAANIKAFLEKK